MTWCWKCCLRAYHNFFSLKPLNLQIDNQHDQDKAEVTVGDGHNEDLHVASNDKDKCSSDPVS
jgi:hypothetical protein